jgi:hypothetical protein
MLMVAVSAIGVGFFILVIIFLRAFLDASIKSPEKASELSGLPTITALPSDTPQMRKMILMDDTQNALLEQMISSLVLKLREVENEHFTLIFYSLRPSEGKTYVAHMLMRRLTAINGAGIYLHPEFETDETPFVLDRDKVLSVPYRIPENLIKIASPEELAPTLLTPELKNKYAFTVVEIPPLNKFSIPTELVRKANLSFLVVNAQRTWSAADNHLQKLYSNAIEHDACLVLNQTHPDYLENLMGEIPKPRTLIRKWIKKLFTLQFSKS